MKAEEYFIKPQTSAQKQFCALLGFFKDGLPAQEVAKKYGYTTSTLYTLVRNFKKQIKNNPASDPFFKINSPGRKKHTDHQLKSLVISLRHKNYSIPQIANIVETSTENKISHSELWHILNKEGFKKLQRRSQKNKKHSFLPENILLPKVKEIDYSETSFTSEAGALLMVFAKLLRKINIENIINKVNLPGVHNLTPIQSFCSYLALKLNANDHNIKNSVWRIDRGLGLFAGLNIPPDTAWFRNYSKSVSNNKSIKLLYEFCNHFNGSDIIPDLNKISSAEINYILNKNIHEVLYDWSYKTSNTINSLIFILHNHLKSHTHKSALDTTIEHPGGPLNLNITFDFAMTIICFGLYAQLDRFLHNNKKQVTSSIISKLRNIDSKIKITQDSITVAIKHKGLLNVLKKIASKQERISWLNNAEVCFV